MFSSSVSTEVLPRAQKPHAQERSLDQIATIVLAKERNRGSRSPVHEMCKCAVVARCSGEQVQHPVDTLDGGFARDPATLGCHDDRHDPEAGSANGGFVVRCVCTCSTPIGCETTDRMAPVPQKLESLALHGPEQLPIGNFR